MEEHKKWLTPKKKLDNLFNEVSAQRPHRGHMCQEQTWKYGTSLSQDERERRSNEIWLKNWNYQKEYNKRGKHHSTAP